MASTYPLEVVEAARWSHENSSVTGQALEAAMQAQPWDPSVKALAFETLSITPSMPTIAAAAYLDLRDEKAVTRRSEFVFVLFMDMFLSRSIVD